MAVISNVSSWMESASFLYTIWRRQKRALDIRRNPGKGRSFLRVISGVDMRAKTKHWLAVVLLSGLPLSTIAQTATSAHSPVYGGYNGGFIASALG